MTRILIGLAGILVILLIAFALSVDRRAIRLRVVGAPIRSTFRANWKMYVENVNDTVHPPATHQSVTDSAGTVWAGGMWSVVRRFAKTE